MKDSLRVLAEAINRADPSAAFSFRLWDGEVMGYGSSPRITLVLKSQGAAGALFTKGFTGFGGAYVSGELRVEGDLQELLRLGFITGFGEKVSLREKIRILPFRASKQQRRSCGRTKTSPIITICPPNFTRFFSMSP